MPNGIAAEGTATQHHSASGDDPALLLVVGTEPAVSAVLDELPAGADGLAVFRETIAADAFAALLARLRGTDRIGYRLAGETADGEVQASLSGFAVPVASASEPVSDAITQALLLLLGSGPAVAAYQNLLSAQQANEAMFQHAVGNQQRPDILGMCMTAKSVRYMLDGGEA